MFIRSDIHYTSGKEIEFLDNNMESLVNKNFINPDEEINSRGQLPENVTSTLEKDYLDLVKQSIAGINNNQFQKVVPSRIKVVDIPSDFDIIENSIW